MVRKRVSRNDTPQRILQEAAALFCSVGYRTTTMRDIMDACNLTAGAFYNHFPSKDDLLFTIIKNAHASLESELEQALSEAPSDPTSQLAAFAQTVTHWHCLHHDEAFIANREYTELSPANLRKIIVRRRWLRDELQSILLEAGAMGNFDSTAFPAGKGDQELASFLSMSLLGMYISVADWFQPDGPVKPDDLAALHAELTTRAVLGWKIAVPGAPDAA